MANRQKPNGELAHSIPFLEGVPDVGQYIADAWKAQQELTRRCIDIYKSAFELLKHPNKKWSIGKLRGQEPEEAKARATTFYSPNGELNLAVTNLTPDTRHTTDHAVSFVYYKEGSKYVESLVILCSIDENGKYGHTIPGFSVDDAEALLQLFDAA
jgi:hypothetical protein